MKLLMDKALEEMKEEGCDMAVLGGQRQRYEYWGFTPCGITVELYFNKSNIKHSNIELSGGYEFGELDENCTEDLDKAISLHNGQKVHAIRERKDFPDISRSWSSRVLFIRKNSEFCGYLCVSSNGEKISEIVLTNPIDIDKVVISYMKNFSLNKLQVDLNVLKTQEFMNLSRFCEDYSIKSSCNIYVINYEKVIKAFMNLKNSLSPLTDGVLVLQIEDKGKYRIEVKTGAVTVGETDEAFDIVLSHLDASALLFSHATFINSAYGDSHPLVKAWFPLPLFYPVLDNV